MNPGLTSREIMILYGVPVPDSKEQKIIEMMIQEDQEELREEHEKEEALQIVKFIRPEILQTAVTLEKALRHAEGRGVL